MGTKWSKHVILEKIRELHATGISLNPGEILKSNHALYLASRSYVGSWRKAVEEAGFSLKDFKIKQTRPKKQWSKEAVIGAIKARIEDGLQVNSNHMQVHERPLFRAGFIYFGGWPQAVAAAGFDYEDIRRKKKKWERKEVLDEIRQIVSRGESINAGHIAAHYGGIHNAGCRYFGSWDGAVKAAGFDPEDVRQKRRARTGEEIVCEIQAIASRNEPLSYSHVREINVSLLQAAARHFGSWEVAVATAGFNYSDYKMIIDWSAEIVREEILALAERGEPLNIGYVQVNYNKLSTAAYRYYGTWDAALIASGFDPEDARLRRSWTPEKIVAEIESIHTRGETLNGRDIAAGYFALYHSACYHFGSWRAALEAYGVDPREVELRKAVWLPEEVLAELRNIVARNEPLNPGYIAVHYTRLYSAACSCFGSWDETVRTLGFNPRDVYVRIREKDIRESLAQKLDADTKARTRAQLRKKRLSKHRKRR